MNQYPAREELVDIPLCSNHRAINSVVPIYSIVEEELMGYRPTATAYVLIIRGD